MRQLDDKLYVEHILQCIDEVYFHLGDQGRQGYLTSITTKAAIERTLHIMFESSQRLSPALKQQYAEVPWNEMAAIRNKLVHGYLGEIDDEAVWEVIDGHLPEIKRAFIRIYEEHYD
jgi:uncharacterized protein with HEPN domain